jgi:2-dehydro-3-deoxy-D-arabinonate dehydratase
LKLYKTSKGPVIEKNGRFYLTNENWDRLVNNDDLVSTLENLVKSAVEVLSTTVESSLPPIGSQQELWACGVTYLRSMVGRQEESKAAGGSDFYSKVYEAERPECFFKSNPSRIVGMNGKVRIRKDSTWDVPEPELTLLVSSSGKIVGYTVGNDMSSRSIEGENPLYLPQAKTYDGCAALGPCIYVTNTELEKNTQIRLTINRDNSSVFEGEVGINQMKRSLNELVSYIYRESSFPNGCMIMTGTGIVPGNGFTLLSGDEIIIEIDSIGKLVNVVA